MSGSGYVLLVGGCVESMQRIKEKSVHCCVTSPPYFGLRDYGQDGQIGLEPTPDEFVAALAHGRKAVLCELNPDYAEMVPERVAGIVDAMGVSPHSGGARSSVDHRTDK